MTNIPPVDRSKTTLTDSVVEGDYRDLKENGQQKSYLVLTQEERAKGFVRPVRSSYRHVGAPGPKYPLRDLTEAEAARYSDVGYVKFEAYPEDKEQGALGRFWQQKQLDEVGAGCGTETTMGNSLAETYARDPKFYGGTFCCGCGTHKPVNEFVWKNTDERVGS